MIRDLTIENFRTFRHFKLSDLGRVNLIVGGNGSGKTSVLEALHLVTSAGFVHSMVALASQRGELIGEALESGWDSIDFSHFFYGHSLSETTPIAVTYSGDEGHLSFSARPIANEKSPSGKSLEFNWNGSVQQGPTLSQPVSSTGVVKIGHDLLSWSERLFRTRSLLVTSASLAARDAVEFFDAIVLSEAEDLLLEALKTVNPQIQRLAPKHDFPFESVRRGGFHVRLEGQQSPVPIGVLGDGVWRMLSLGLSLAMTTGGILMIDDIDTGLHYSVMERMWQLVRSAAEKFNVQVFATSHSHDCVQALASICRDDDSARDVSIQRIEKDSSKSVVVTESMILSVAERGIEVR